MAPSAAAELFDRFFTLSAYTGCSCSAETHIVETEEEGACDPPALFELTLEYPWREVAEATAHFAEDRVIGRGHAGTVFRGDLVDGLPVAVKVLTTAAGGGLGHEVRLLSRCNHPNVVMLLGFAVSGQSERGAVSEAEPLLSVTDPAAVTRHALVYELLPGGSAYKKVHSHGAHYSWDERLVTALEASRGLAHLHKFRPELFHRDIKSANILFSEEGSAKIADFGLACASRTSSEMFSEVSVANGTPGYCAPEYARSSVVTEASEVYSMGMVLIELLTGHKPAKPGPEKDKAKLVFLLSEIRPEGCSSSTAETRLLSRLDTRAKWPQSVAEDLANFSLKAVQDDPEQRPRFLETVAVLQNVLLSARAQVVYEGSLSGRRSGAEGAGRGGGMHSAANAAPAGPAAAVQSSDPALEKEETAITVQSEGETSLVTSLVTDSRLEDVPSVSAATPAAVPAATGAAATPAAGAGQAGADAGITEASAASTPGPAPSSSPALAPAPSPGPSTSPAPSPGGGNALRSPLAVDRDRLSDPPSAARGAIGWISRKFAGGGGDRGAADPARIDGRWVHKNNSQTIETIKGDFITGEDGTVTKIVARDKETITIDFEGNAFRATLVGDQLFWDDGDIWIHWVPPGSGGDTSQEGRSPASTPGDGSGTPPPALAPAAGWPSPAPPLPGGASAASSPAPASPSPGLGAADDAVPPKATPSPRGGAGADGGGGAAAAAAMAMYGLGEPVQARCSSRPNGSFASADDSQAPRTPATSPLVAKDGGGEQDRKAAEALLGADRYNRLRHISEIGK